MQPITDYATLIAAFESEVKRTDLTVSAPAFIQLCEAEFYDELLLKNTEYEAPLTATIGNNYIALPSDYISPITLWLLIDTVRVELDIATPQELPYEPSKTQPMYWAIDGNNIRFDCPTAQAYTVYFRYIRKDSLNSTTNTTNYLLRRRPDLYLYGVLKQAALFSQDDEAVMKWDSLYQKARKALMAAENRARSMVPLRTDINSGRRRGNILTGGYY